MTSTYKLNKELVDNLPDCLNNKIDLDLTNTQYHSEGILSIPQMVKVELADSTITVKAGSKVFTGLGTSYTITQDITKTTASGGDNQQYLMLKSDGTTLVSVGVTDSTFAYNSSTGFIHNDTYGDYYLPIALTTHSGTSYTSIDNVFNGVGYYRSYCFVHGGIKAKICTGLNSNGTYQHSVIESLFTFNDMTPWGGTYSRRFNIQFMLDGTIQSQPDFRYNTQDSNYMWRQNNSVWEFKNTSSNWVTRPLTHIGQFDWNGSVISKLTTAEVDSVIGSNVTNLSHFGKAYLSKLGMPGNYISITYGASESNYKAPAHGYFYAWAVSSSNSVSYLQFRKTTFYTIDHVPSSDQWLMVHIPVKAGENVKLLYQNVHSESGYQYPMVLRFYYTNGEDEA